MCGHRPLGGNRAVLYSWCRDINCTIRGRRCCGTQERRLQPSRQHWIRNAESRNQQALLRIARGRSSRRVAEAVQKTRGTGASPGGKIQAFHIVCRLMLAKKKSLSLVFTSPHPGGTDTRRRTVLYWP